MAVSLRLSPQTSRVLDAFLEAPRKWTYGYDLSRETGLKSGTLYPILMRLSEEKLVETRWEVSEAGKPPRHMYRLTGDGVRWARGYVRACTSRWLRQPALDTVKS